jgi:hypothetical protein
MKVKVNILWLEGGMRHAQAEMDAQGRLRPVHQSLVG